MSRIHEALKRAELERASGQNGQQQNGHGERAGQGSAVETAPMPAAVSPQFELPPAGAHIPAEAEPGAVQIEAMWSKCTRKDWDPDPKVIVFRNEDPHYPGAEQFRTLRSRLNRMRETQPLQTILISSAVPAEGKTTVSCNLAYALAQQQGSRVLLVDADLRSPRVHFVLGTPAAPGLAEYLQNTATEMEIINCSSADGLCFIPAGNHVSHPSELISSERMRNFLESVKPAFDWIIIDSPPALPVADASVLGGLVDGVLFVVRANSTPAEASQRACKELRDAHILGVILNTADEAAGYGSYYSGGYGPAPYGLQKK